MKDYHEYSIEELIEIIHRLSHDEVFGILTRQGLEEVMDGFEYNAIVIDFNVNELNKYEVNNKIKLFLFGQKIKHNLMIGRLFSEYEVVILTRGQDIENILKSLYKDAEYLKLSFEYYIFYHISSLWIK